MLAHMNFIPCFCTESPGRLQYFLRTEIYLEVRRYLSQWMYDKGACDMSGTHGRVKYDITSYIVENMKVEKSYTIITCLADLFKQRRLKIQLLCLWLGSLLHVSPCDHCHHPPECLDQHVYQCECLWRLEGHHWRGLQHGNHVWL
jgi:hypothetical protein